MIFIYSAYIVTLTLAALIFRRYRAGEFKNLSAREHPFKCLYPFVAKIYDLLGKFAKPQSNSKLSVLLKQLSVKENVENELFIYKTKRLSTVFGMLFVICALGMLLCIKNLNSGALTSLERGDYGTASQTYTLNASYGNERETVMVTLDPVKYSEDQILDIFDASAEGIRKAVLAENASFDAVTRPLDLIGSYGPIKISWQINDPETVNYSGQISSELEEGDEVLVILQATLSIDDTSIMITIPANICGASPTAKELLIENIMTSITEENSVYEKEVALPESINGVKLRFFSPSDNSGPALLILGIIAAAILFFGYEKMLEDKLKERSDQLLLDFSEVVFKLSLLYEAGMSIYKAWEKIVDDYEASHPGTDRFVYKEMKLALEKIKSGVSEAEAYGQFGKRCGLHPYVKLGNILEQNLSKGTKGMKELLKQEAREAFESRKRAAKKKGEEAGTKMLVPMVMMLAITIAIVAVPALLSLKL